MQLDVADDDYQRRITLGGDTQNGEQGTLADIYIGSSPGFRRAHVRLANQQPIRALEISVNELSIDLDDWLDKSLLAIQAPSRMKGDDFTLIRNGEGWSLEGQLPQDKILSIEQAQALAQAVATLRVEGIASDDVVASHRSPTVGSAVPEAITPLMLVVTDTDGTTFSLAIMSKDNVVTATRDDIDAAFTLSKATQEKLVKLAALDGLLVDKQAAVEDASTGDTVPSTNEADRTHEAEMEADPQD